MIGQNVSWQPRDIVYSSQPARCHILAWYTKLVWKWYRISCSAEADHYKIYFGGGVDVFENDALINLCRVIRFLLMRLQHTILAIWKCVHGINLELGEAVYIVLEPINIGLLCLSVERNSLKWMIFCVLWVKSSLNNAILQFLLTEGSIYYAARMTHTFHYY